MYVAVSSPGTSNSQRKPIQAREHALKAGIAACKKTKSPITKVRVKTENSDDGAQGTDTRSGIGDGGNAAGRKRRCRNPPVTSSGEEMAMSRAVEVEDDGRVLML